MCCLGRPKCSEHYPAHETSSTYNGSNQAGGLVVTPVEDNAIDELNRVLSHISPPSTTTNNGTIKLSRSNEYGVTAVAVLGGRYDPNKSSYLALIAENPKHPKQCHCQ